MIEAPREPLPILSGPTPTDVEMPPGDSVSRTPGKGEKDLRNRHPMMSAKVTLGHWHGIPYSGDEETL